MDARGSGNGHGRPAQPRTVTSLESLRDLYLAERQRRESIRSQLAIPVSIISFSIFGYVAFAQYFNVARADPVTLTMDGLMAVSLLALFSAMAYLARVEASFMTVEVATLEDLDDADNEYQYFEAAYFRTRAENAKAARLRARGFLLLLVALGAFVLAVALLPYHLNETGVHGRSAEAAAALPRPIVHPTAARGLVQVIPAPDGFSTLPAPPSPPHRG